MLLNAIEKALMNNPARAAIQGRVEVPRLLSLGGPMRKGRALEIGCGRGVGSGLILDRFGAERLDAFDLDPDMVALARERLACRGDRVRLWVGDAERVEAASDTYDAVFDFGIIHHIPRWQDGPAGDEPPRYNRPVESVRPWGPPPKDAASAIPQ
jgi:SAM-dependent methyltransferase